MAATQPKKYFITPDFDCPPDSAIRIGQVLTSPTLPYEPLNEDNITAPPPEITIPTTKTNFKATRSQLSTGSYGIWAQVLEGAFGVNLGLNHDSETGQDIEFAIDEVKTTFIKPTGAASKAYMRSCVESDDVQPYFEGSLFSKSVYLIVGLKIATGAKVNYGGAKSEELKANASVDGTGGGVPVTVKAKAESKTQTNETTEWRDEKSFVFGYQLRKIKCKKGKMVKDEEFNKGAFLNAEVARKEDQKLYYSVGEEDTGIEEVDAVDAVSFQSFTDDDCVFFLPTHPEEPNPEAECVRV